MRLTYFVSHRSRKLRTVSTRLPSFISNFTSTNKKTQTSQKNPKTPADNGYHNKNIPTVSSSSLLRPNHTKPFAKTEPTRSRMNQQIPAKPESHKSPGSESPTRHRWRVIFRHGQAGNTTRLENRNPTSQHNWAPSSPRGRIPKYRSRGFTPWLGEIALSCRLMTCSMCLYFVFGLCIFFTYYSFVQENLKLHSFLMQRNLKSFRTSPKYQLWIH